jgi:hypothetical protein
MRLPAALPLLAALAGLLAAPHLAGCTGGLAETDDTAVDFPESPLMTIPSEDGAFSIEVRTAPIQPPSRGRIDVDLTITTGDGEPRDDLALHVVPWMTDMAHGSSTLPQVTPTGDGHYTVGPIDMFMSGRWELRTEIAGPADDRAKIVFEIP